VQCDSAFKKSSQPSLDLLQFHFRPSFIANSWEIQEKYENEGIDEMKRRKEKMF
jgi:hypothetical protein